MSFFLESFLKYRRLKNIFQSRPHLARPQPVRLSTESHIVVVGAGIASVSYIDAMIHYGFKNITLIAPNEQWGGKCVFQGCMPFEYFWQKGQNPKKFSRLLGQQVEAKIKGLGVKVIKDEALSTDGNQLNLKSGSNLSFDFLALGIGSVALNESKIENALQLADIWEKDFKNKKVVLLSDGSETSWSLAATLNKLGADVLLLSSGSVDGLHATDSFKYFQARIVSEGVVAAKIHKLISMQEGKVAASTDQGFFEGSYDYILDWQSALPKSFIIDGNPKGLQQAYLWRESFYLKKNILLLGEASAALSAAEGETSSLAASLSLRGSEFAQNLEWYEQPMRIHAEQSWAYCGPQIEIFEKCEMIDFSELGWSQIDNQPGRLWYRFDAVTGKVTSMHIVHKDAGELINIANMLLKFPINSSSWLSGFVHPSAAEIFKRLAIKLVGVNNGNF